ncbi:hypothetical protein ISS37_01365 [candidate division KSB1 bacterium]|nr:hypothetical protein [candidate division KSB1 bacterium]
MNDYFSNKDFLEFIKLLGTFCYNHSIAIIIVVVVLLYAGFYLRKLRTKISTYQGNCDYCNDLLEKIKSVVREFIDSEKYGIIFLIFSILIGLIFYGIANKLPLDKTTHDALMVLSFAMYFIALVSNLSRVSFLKKFYKIF